MSIIRKDDFEKVLANCKQHVAEVTKSGEPCRLVLGFFAVPEGHDDPLQMPAIDFIEVDDG